VLPLPFLVCFCLPLQLGLFCVYDGHNSRSASEQAQQLLPDLLTASLTRQRQQQEPKQQQQQPQQHLHQSQQQQQHQQCHTAVPMLSDEPAVAAALTDSFLATDAALTTDDGCTATALLLEGCGDGSVLLRVANVGDSLALLVNLTRWVTSCWGPGQMLVFAAGDCAHFSGV
jgi:serine/threonine protein phosphatase PrpC